MVSDSKCGEAFVVDVVSLKRLEKYSSDEIQIARVLISANEFNKSEIIKEYKN